jgi:short-subunit dehydrogenase
LKGKVVIITGASSGIGEALAYEFAAAGSKVVLGARNQEKLISIANDIRSTGGECIYYKTDVSSENDCRNLIFTAINNHGQIDILINNAGISMRSLFNDVDLNVLKKLMDVNFWGTVYCTKYALPHILKQNGSIAGISSIAGMVGLPARTGYSASKFAMNGFLESLRTENIKNGLHVLIAYPGFTASNIRKTSLGPSGNSQGESPRDENKMMTSAQVAKRTYIAIKNRNNKIVLTTEGKLVSFISKFMPNILYKLVYNSLAKEPNSPFK